MELSFCEEWFLKIFEIHISRIIFVYKWWIFKFIGPTNELVQFWFAALGMFDIKT